MNSFIVNFYEQYEKVYYLTIFKNNCLTIFKKGKKILNFLDSFSFKNI